MNSACQVSILFGAFIPHSVMDEGEGVLDVGSIDVAAGGSSVENRHQALLITFKEDEDDDEFLDVESPQSPSDLDEVVLSAEMAQPLQDQSGWAQGNVGGEMTMFMDHQAVENEILAAERAQRQPKRTVKFKDEGSLVNEFPNERLWSAG